MKHFAEFCEFVRDDRTLHGLIASGVASSSLVGLVAVIGPPYPGLMPIVIWTLIVELLVHIWCFVSYNSSICSLDIAKLALHIRRAIGLLIVVMVAYILLQFFLVVRDDSGNSEAKGFLSPRGVAYCKANPGCNDLDLIQSAEGEADKVYQPWSLYLVRAIILLCWMVLYAVLSFTLCLCVTRWCQHRKPPPPTPLMETFTITLLDFLDSDPPRKGTMFSYEAHVQPNKPFIVSWNDKRCPTGFHSVVEGVMFVSRSCNFSTLQKTTFEVRTSCASKLQELTEGYAYVCKWRAPDSHGKLMLIAILPKGLTFAFDPFEPIADNDLSPTRFKSIGERLALFWELRAEDYEVRWKVRPIRSPALECFEPLTAVESVAALESEVARLNQQAPPPQAEYSVVRLYDDPSVIKDKSIEPTNDGEQLECGVTRPSGNANGPISTETNANDSAQSPSPPKSPPPRTSTDWLLETVRRVPTLVYAIGVVGLVAAAAIAIGLFLGHWEYAFFGGLSVFGGMILVRLYVAIQPENVTINPSLPIQAVVWAVVIAFIAILGIGVVAIGAMVFTNVGIIGSAGGSSDKITWEHNWLTINDPPPTAHGNNVPTTNRAKRVQTLKSLRLSSNPDLDKERNDLVVSFRALHDCMFTHISYHSQL